MFNSIFKTLGIDKKTSKIIYDEYNKQVKKLPLDIPHPDFQGPF